MLYREYGQTGKKVSLLGFGGMRFAHIDDHEEGADDPIGSRLRWHWNLERSAAGNCTGCGKCENACTQHLNIIDRLKEIASPKAPPKGPPGAAAK